MYDGVNRNLSRDSEKILTGWDGLIKEAKDQIKDLQRAVEHFERNKAKGEPFFSKGSLRPEDKPTA